MREAQREEEPFLNWKKKPPPGETVPKSNPDAPKTRLQWALHRKRGRGERVCVRGKDKPPLLSALCRDGRMDFRWGDCVTLFIHTCRREKEKNEEEREKEEEERGRGGDRGGRRRYIGM